MSSCPPPCPPETPWALPTNTNKQKLATTRAASPPHCVLRCVGIVLGHHSGVGGVKLHQLGANRLVISPLQGGGFRAKSNSRWYVSLREMSPTPLDFVWQISWTLPEMLWRVGLCRLASAGVAMQGRPICHTLPVMRVCDCLIAKSVPPPPLVGLATNPHNHACIILCKGRWSRMGQWDVQEKGHRHPHTHTHTHTHPHNLNLKSTKNLVGL